MSEATTPASHTGDTVRDPLVSIGIPTHRRPHLLTRALASAQAQSYPHLEIIISDNASADETTEIGEAAAAQDPRVTYLRGDRNVGPTANFNRLFERCRGEFVLMLADDDRLEVDYVAECVGVLIRRPELALVAGRARYMRGGAPAGEGVLHRHLDPDPARRVLDYLSRVQDNGVFYGVVRGASLRRAGPMPNVLGNDWLHVARIAALGGVEMIESIHIERELDGTSADVQTILQTFGRRGWQARVPQLVIAWEIFRDLARGGEPYSGIPPARRLGLAPLAAFASVAWPDLAWHLVTPTVAAVGRRPRGRGVWRAYERATRALGAGAS